MKPSGFQLDPFLFACPKCGKPTYTGCVDDPSSPEWAPPHQERVNLAVASMLDAIEAWKAHGRSVEPSDMDVLRRRELIRAVAQVRRELAAGRSIADIGNAAERLIMIAEAIAAEHRR